MSSDLEQESWGLWRIENTTYKCCKFWWKWMVRDPSAYIQRFLTWKAIGESCRWRQETYSLLWNCRVSKRRKKSCQLSLSINKILMQLCTGMARMVHLTPVDLQTLLLQLQEHLVSLWVILSHLIPYVLHWWDPNPTCFSISLEAIPRASLALNSDDEGCWVHPHIQNIKQFSNTGRKPNLQLPK